MRCWHPIQKCLEQREGHVKRTEGSRMGLTAAGLWPLRRQVLPGRIHGRCYQSMAPQHDLFHVLFPSASCSQDGFSEERCEAKSIKIEVQARESPKMQLRNQEEDFSVQY